MQSTRCSGTPCLRRLFATSQEWRNSTAQRSPFSPTFERSSQILYTQRFYKIVVHSRLQALFTVARHRVSRHCDDSRMPVMPSKATYLSGGRVAIHFGHLYVKEYNVIRLPAKGFQHL